jgi:hypothetical protein
MKTDRPVKLIELLFLIRLDSFLFSLILYLSRNVGIYI